MLPFSVSISALTLTQAATVGLPANDPVPSLGRLRGRGWALIPALSIVVVIVAVGAAASVAQGLTYLAVVAVPPLAALALGRLSRFGAPRLALLVVPLFLLAWLDRRGLAGQAAGVALSALSCVTLGVLLVALAPRAALKLGVVAMALVDTGFVVANLLQAPNAVLNAAHPAAGLPQLQRELFGSALMGYGDVFIAALVGALLAASASLQRRGVALAAIVGLLFDLLFFVVNNLPATVPIALTLLLLDRAGRSGQGIARRVDIGRVKGRFALLCGLLAVVAGLALPAIANAAPTQTGADLPQAGAIPGQTGGAASSPLAFPLQHITALSPVPPGFSSNGYRAIEAAKATRELQELHRSHHPMRIVLYIWAGSRWEVDFYYKHKLLADVDVSPAGHVTAIWTGLLTIDYAGRGHYAGIFDSPWVVLPFCLLFFVPFFDRRRPFRLLHLDLLMLLSFGVSYWFYNRAHLETAVWLFYPPLLYLLGRMLAIGLRARRTSTVVATRLPIAVLGVGLLVLVGARIGLDLAQTKPVIDVGYASVIGAHRLAHNMSLYYASSSNGDTYGPLMYLAYVPFEQLWPWHGQWDYLTSARVAAITFDVLTIVGLVALGMRLRSGVAGRRLGLSLGWAWAAFPFTLFGLMNNTNDGFIAMLLVFALLVLASPPARGAILGLATAAKFFPLALLPLFARGTNALALRGRPLKQALVCAAAFVAIVSLAIGLYLPRGGISEFYDHTIGFQLGRADVDSIWALHPALDWLKTLISVAAVALAAGVTIWPRGKRTFVQVTALAAAVVIAVQLPALHWFYYYIVWFAPLVLVALFSRTTTFDAPPPQPLVTAEATPEPELVGAAV